MATITLQTNLNCGSCVSKVAPHLNAEPGIEQWHVDTADPAKPLTVQGSASPQRIAQLVAQAGFRVLDVLDTVAAATQAAAPAVTTAHVHPAAPTAESAASWLATYKPLLLVLGFIVGGVLLREAITDRWAWMDMMANFMGGFFVVFGFFKLLDINGFASSYSSYDLVAKRWFGWGYVYPFVELALGILFFTGFWPVATNAITLVLMLVGLAGVWISVRQKRAIQCACLGTVFNLPMSTVTIVEDGGMALMAAIMLAQML